jgi:hypothetical protein
MELLRPLADAEYPAASVASGVAAATVGTWAPGPQGVMVWSTESTPIPAFTPIPFFAPQTGSGAPWRVSVLRVAIDGTVYAKPINIR